MLSTGKATERKKNLIPEREKQTCKLNFLVNGSSVPIHNQQPKALGECNKCKNTSREQKRKEFSFPLDKIIYLSERLELTSLNENKIKAISLSAVDVNSKKCLIEGTKKSRSEKSQEKLSDFISDPDFDFSLDLSNISNIGDESDESCDLLEEEPSSLHYNCESFNVLRSGIKGGEPSRVSKYSDQDCFYPLLKEYKKSKSLDSVNVYVNSVNKQKELVKFFRPCCSCGETWCLCSGSPARSDLFPLRNSARANANKYRDETRNSDIMNKLAERNEGGRYFACECESCPVFGNVFSPFKHFHQETFETNFFSPSCEVECRCRNEEPLHNSPNDLVSSGRILAYTSSLASAARSARILASDLEYILSKLSSETE